VGEHHVDQSRRQEGVRHPVPLDEAEEVADVGAAHHDDLAAERHDREAVHPVAYGMLDGLFQQALLAYVNGRPAVLDTLVGQVRAVMPLMLAG
jgi:hypothetical protein